MYIHQKTCIEMYIEALLIVVSNWKLPKYLNKKIE